MTETAGSHRSTMDALNASLSSLRRGTQQLDTHIRAVFDSATTLGNETFAIKARTSALNRAFANIRDVKDGMERLLQSAKACATVATRVAEMGASAPPKELEAALEELRHRVLSLEDHRGVRAAREALGVAALARRKLVAGCLTRLHASIQAAGIPASPEAALEGCPEVEELRSKLAPFAGWAATGGGPATSGTTRGQGSASASATTRSSGDGRGGAGAESRLGKPLREGELGDLRNVVRILLGAGGEKVLVEAYGSERAKDVAATLAAVLEGAGLTGAGSRRAPATFAEAQARAQGFLVYLHALEALLRREMDGLGQVFTDDTCEGLEEQVLDAAVVPAVAAMLLKRPGQWLLEEGVAVCGTDKCSDKVFLLLDLHSRLAASLSRMAEIVNDAAQGVLAIDVPAENLPAFRELQSLQPRLVNAIRHAVADLDEMVTRQHIEARVAHPTVHPLTAAAMAYLKRLHGHAFALSSLLGKAAAGDKPPGTPGVRSGRASEAGSEGASGTAGGDGAGALRKRLSTVTLQVVNSVTEQLEGMAQEMEGEDARDLFLAANQAFMLGALRGCGAADALGPNWVDKMRQVLVARCARYRENAWGPLLQVLKDGTGEVAPYRSFAGHLPNDARDLIKQRFRDFNRAMHALHRRQTPWDVADAALRAHLVRTVSVEVVPAYAAFLDAHRGLQFTKHPDRFLVYSLPRLREALATDILSGRDVPALLPDLPEVSEVERKGGRLLSRIKGPGALVAFSPEIANEVLPSVAVREPSTTGRGVGAPGSVGREGHSRGQGDAGGAAAEGPGAGRPASQGGAAAGAAAAQAAVSGARRPSTAGLGGAAAAAGGVRGTGPPQVLGADIGKDGIPAMDASMRSRGRGPA